MKNGAVSVGLLAIGLASLPVLFACSSGTHWVNAPFRETHQDEGIRLAETRQGASAPSLTEPDPAANGARRAVINDSSELLTEDDLADAEGNRPQLSLEGTRKAVDGPLDGRLLGVFRNTYYDFPAEFNFSGSAQVPLMDQACKKIRDVPADFFAALCVQGSGTLQSGETVSFAKRDCDCAPTCPRTGQKICFDRLDQAEYPWGRGALGQAITPLLSVAVDSAEIPLGTKIYILEYDGILRRPGGAPHDGCFIAEDRGMKVVGKHVDIFTGNPSITAHFNEQVPSNRGVHVYVGTARCH